MARPYERLELRLPRELKALLECAVGIEGGSINGFVASAVHRAATDTLERHQRTVASARDWKRIIDALEETDYQPTPANVEDLALYRRFVETGNLPPVRIERLTEEHEASDFRCGDRGLDRYLVRFAAINAREALGVTFVAVEERTIQGYYTLANGRVDPATLPSEETEGLPRYPVPSVLLARLAVHREVQGRGLGRVLLTNALERFLAIGELSGARLFEVDALDEKAKAFYRRRGYREFLDDPLHLFLTRQEAERILGRDQASEPTPPTRE